MKTSASAVSRKLRALGYDLRRTTGIRIKDCSTPLEKGDVYIHLSGAYIRRMPRGLDGLLADLDAAGVTVVESNIADLESLDLSVLYIAKKEA